MIDAEDRVLLDETVRAALADNEAGNASHNTIDALLKQLDWLDLLDADPLDAIEIVFRALGHFNAPSTAMDDVLSAALDIRPVADVAVLVPPFASWEPAGRIDLKQEIDARGLATSRSDTAKDLLVVCGTAEAPRLARVGMSEATSERIVGVDPGANLRAIIVSTRATEVSDLDPQKWERTIAWGRLAAAYEISGAARAMLEMACSHALERHQFGHPIAGFQALRHRLAEALVAIEALDATLVSARHESTPLTAALAKAQATRSIREVTRHCQQVLAGVGFTTEHPFHRFLKRTMVLEGVFGSADEILLEVGQRVLAQRLAPTLIDL